MKNQVVLDYERQYGQPGDRDVGFTAAFLGVQVYTTLRAKTPAIAAADRLHRQRQEHLFGQNVSEEKSLALKKRDFSVIQLEAFFLFLRHGGQGPVKEVKVAGHIFIHRLQTSRAG